MRYVTHTGSMLRVIGCIHEAIIRTIVCSSAYTRQLSVLLVRLVVQIDSADSCLSVYTGRPLMSWSPVMSCRWVPTSQCRLTLKPYVTIQPLLGGGWMNWCIYPYTCRLARGAVQTSIWPSWCHCHSLSLASVKSRLVLPFWYRLTRVVPDNGPLNRCVYVDLHGSC